MTPLHSTNPEAPQLRHPWLDQPEVDPDRDALRRTALARTIHHLIATGLPGEPLRIGVYGDWGEGKSTVLQFVQRFCQDDQIPVIWFNPWSAKDTAALWRLFSRQVREALRAERSWTEFAAELGVRMLSLSDWSLRLVAKWKPWVAELLPLQKAADAAARSLEQKRPALDQGSIARYLRKLPPNRQLVVMIDDLDRAAPEVVPHLLLALRELFDVRGCAFIVALDPRVLARAFPLVHPGWGSTGEFIEKIIQFPFWLHPPTRDDVLHLANTSLERLPLSVDRDAVRDLADLLPKNPRRLKQYFRNVLRLRAIIERHDPDELRWSLLLLFELMRALAPLVTAHLCHSDTFLKNLAIATLFPKDKTNDEHFKKLLTQLDADTHQAHLAFSSAPDVEQEFRTLIVAFTERAGIVGEDNLMYWARLDEAPPVFTWREYRELFSDWRSTPTVAAIRSFVALHARRYALVVDVVTRDLLRTSIQYRQGVLDRAADVSLEAEQETLLHDAADALQLISQIVLATPGGLAQLHVDVEDFHLLYEHIARWAHFANTAAYRDARNSERRLLLELARCGEDIAAAELHRLQVWMPHSFAFDSPQAHILHSEVCSMLSTFVITELRARFGRDNGIGSLWGRERAFVQKYFLFRLDSGFYSPETLEFLKDISERSANTKLIQANFVGFLHLLTVGITNSLGVVSNPEILPLARNREIVGMAWKAATVHPLQVRTRGSLTQTREILTRAAETDEHLPLPHWWTTHDQTSDNASDPSTEAGESTGA